MSFEAILDQALVMLQRRGRVTYRALKLQFSLDDDHLEALKDELLYAQHVAVDEEGRVLVWTGGPGGSPAPASTPSPSGPSGRQAELPANMTPQPIDARVPDAERRQLTVLFCDLVDSTVLASQLDPEEWRGVVQVYQDTCATVIARYEGYIAQDLGDGLLVYFGYPRAHEDDAQRVGLGILEAMAQLNAQRHPRVGARRAVPLPAEMRQGLMAYRATGAELGLPHVLAWLAEAYGSAGQAEDGLHVLAEALSIVENQGQR